MKLKSLLAASLLAVASTGAYANDYAPAVVAMTGGPTDWSISFGTSHTDGLNFTDTYQFSYSGAPGSATVAIFNLASPTGDLDFSWADINGTPLLISNTGAFSVSAIFATPVSGLITLTIKGSDTGVASYAGTLDIKTPVPEPATYGMMLGGLALLGVVARRRKG
ncbi:FxDxF family PEP-CTERM protein [Pseudoduganella danionis]|uniref:FxDxF family PEP-CTERM protein n=1 Tax=Pseudoduganella danionis TaxID=1890295 RepID=UPI001E362506|nr:FxDxF family PEP-CTERM protein [Pseudoduganella danionis]